MILAIVRGISDDNAFSLLFNYISGENTINDKINMTTPVISSDKLEMTAPVISKKNYMAFVIPSSYNKDNVPKPINPNIKIEVQPERTVAILRFSGYSSSKNIEKHITELFTLIKKYELKIIGKPYLMRYNSPFTPGLFRRNEVAIEIFD